MAGMDLSNQYDDFDSDFLFYVLCRERSGRARNRYKYTVFKAALAHAMGLYSGLTGRTDAGNHFWVLGFYKEREAREFAGINPVKLTGKTFRSR